MTVYDLMQDELWCQIFRNSEVFLLGEAKNENADAMLLLAMYYNLSDYRDYEKAIEWYQKAADAGCADGYYHLAELYIDHYRDHDKSMEYYQKAVDMGSANAMFEMGRRYYKGFLVHKDEKKAWALFEQAAQLGHGEAWLWLSEHEKDAEKALQYAHEAYYKCLENQW